MSSSTHPGPAGPLPERGAEEGFSAQLATVVANARRRASLSGDREMDTAHLLHGLVEADDAVRELLDEEGPGSAKVLGYLAQRSIGYGLRWRRSVEEAGGTPHSAAAPAALPGWSPGAARARLAALRRAADRGAPQAEALDLLAALAADQHSRAAEVLRRSGADTGELAASLGVSSMPDDTTVTR